MKSEVKLSIPFSELQRKVDDRGGQLIPAYRFQNGWGPIQVVAGNTEIYLPPPTEEPQNGKNGTLKRAREVATGNRVVVQLYNPLISSSLNEFAMGMYAQTRIHHPHIVRGIGFTMIQQSDGLLIPAGLQEHIGNGDINNTPHLLELIKENRDITPSDIFQYMVQIAEAVDAVHDAGFAHYGCIMQHVIVDTNARSAHLSGFTHARKLTDPIPVLTNEYGSYDFPIELRHSAAARVLQDPKGKLVRGIDNVMVARTTVKAIDLSARLNGAEPVELQPLYSFLGNYARTTYPNSQGSALHLMHFIKHLMTDQGQF